MLFYVVSWCTGAEVHESWDDASASMRGRSGAGCRKFYSQEAAEAYVVGLRFVPIPSDDDVVVYTDGAALNRIAAFGAIFVEKGDERNKTERLETAPFTSYRAELLGACLGAEALKGQRGVVLVDCELVARAYREGFPSWWSSQDLFERLRKACREGDVRVRWVKGHSSNIGNSGAHALCLSALRAFV